MFNVKIERLNLSIENAGGHEHRVHPIAARAAALFAERLEERWANNGGAGGAIALDSIAASPLDLHLNGMSDQEAASEIANAWVEALALSLKF